ncbi:MAG: hypothetical protein QOK37_2151 [Thermoanaerobaculia bacterium]|jgi:hypothetical protein|nr:hypothetical protein [Thermoanaerobaculia bacterium]
MSRRTPQLLALALFTAFASNSAAATFEVRILFDTDNNRATGCSVLTAAGELQGVEKIVTTAVAVTGSTAVVTGVRSTTCVAPALSTFSAPSTEDSGGWNAGVSPTGDLLIETHIHPSSLAASLSATPMRIGIALAVGDLSDAVLHHRDGRDLFFPNFAGRHRAVAPVPGVNRIVLDGDGSDWNGISTLTDGRISAPELRIVDAFGLIALDDYFFRIDIQSDRLAPTAFDDGLTTSVGGALNISMASMPT